MSNNQVYVYVCVCVCVCHSSCAIALNKFDKGKKEEGDEEEKKKNWKSVEVGHESWREILYCLRDCKIL